MLLSPRRSVCFRSASSLPPLLLLAFILYVYGTFASMVWRTLSLTVPWSRHAGAVAATLLAAALVSALTALVLLSFARAALSDPGAAPAAAVWATRGLAQEFARRQRAFERDPRIHARKGAQATATTWKASKIILLPWRISVKGAANRARRSAP
jgi:hypothetical protein